MPESQPKILGSEALVERVRALKTAGERVVLCHGCFDIVHPGHIRYLRFARSLGDRLIVTVSADAMVAKGAERPYIPEALRMENLAAFEFVDFVGLSSDAWAGPVLEALQPDVFVKGKEYESSPDPRFAKERQVVEAYGGEVVFGSGDVVFSSTEILRRAALGGGLGLEPEKVQAFCKTHEIDRAGLEQLVRRCGERSVLVLGDPILDQYVHCEEANAASEGPMLDVTPVSEDWFVGGGGLVARQIAAMGARVRFITIAKPGPARERIAEGCARAGVELHCLDHDARPVYEKTRYLVGHQKLFKVNRGLPASLGTTAVAELLAEVRSGLTDHEALVVTDFGYGMFGEPMCSAIAKIASESDKPYYADVSTNGRANLLKFEGPRLVTPTEQELRFALADSESGLSNLAARYYARSQAKNLVVTMGRRGALHFQAPQDEGGRLRTTYLPALEARALDAVGAGDVFLATQVLSDLAGAKPEQALYLASAMAALAVNRLGNDAVGADELAEYLAARPEL